MLSAFSRSWPERWEPGRAPYGVEGVGPGRHAGYHPVHQQVALERGLRFAVRVPNDVTNLSGEDKQVLLSLVEEYRHLP